MAADSYYYPDHRALLRQYAETLESIKIQGENFDRSEALEQIDRILNCVGVFHSNQAFHMARTLARAAMAFELDDDAQTEWDVTVEYLSVTGPNDGTDG